MNRKHFVIYFSSVAIRATILLKQDLRLNNSDEDFTFFARLTDAPSSQVGGAHIIPDGTLQIFGDAELRFVFYAPIKVHKYFTLEFSIVVKTEPEYFHVCLYETEDGFEEEEALVGNEFRCTNVNSYGNVNLNVGRFFDDRITDISAIVFRQINTLTQRLGETDVQDVKLLPFEGEGIFNSDGTCNDTNSYTIVMNGDVRCICIEGFVGSNGGRILGEYDSCVNCLGCALDNEICNRNRDCMMGTCVDNSCAPSVSSIFSAYHHSFFFNL